MKAVMTKVGQIMVTPESDIESYALRVWCKTNYVHSEATEPPRDGYFRGDGLMVIPDWAYEMEIQS